MITTTGTSGRDATLSANLGEHQRHVPSAVAMQIAPIVVPMVASESRSDVGPGRALERETCPYTVVLVIKNGRRRRVDCAPRGDGFAAESER